MQKLILHNLAAAAVSGESFKTLIGLKEKELESLKSVEDTSTEIIDWDRVGVFFKEPNTVETNFLLRHGLPVVIDEPLRSRLEESFSHNKGVIQSKGRDYTHYKRLKPSNSFFDIKDFKTEIRKFEEVIGAIDFLIREYFKSPSTEGPIKDLLDDKQENLDLGIVILKKPMIRGMYEPETAYNVHLEMKGGKEGKVEEIHVHTVEWPRSFKENRHVLI